MRVLVVGPERHPVTDELAALGLELTREGVEAEGLVTLPPEQELAPLAELDGARFEDTVERWAAEPFFAAQPWLAAALERGAGSWVAVTSILGTQPFPGGGAVGAGAMALQTLVRIAALEGGPHGVRANVVAPGWLEGAFPAGLDRDLAIADTPLASLATPGAIANGVAWLLSPAAAHVTGEVLRVDGGYTITRGSRADPRRE
jgi:NAD(P)-dependent dehydrogenase (short-subunit alcohol dehydrogenase family)